MKKIKTLALVLILVVSTLALFACNPAQEDDGYVGIAGVYVNHESSKEFTSYEVAISAIPKDWSLYAPDKNSNEFKNSNSGYIEELDGFVVKKTIEKSTYLGIIKCGTTSVMFENLAITALRVSNGCIILKNVNGEMYVTDFDGKVVVKDVVVGASSKAIDDVIKVLDGELIAVNPLYDANASNSTYTSIYRKSTGKLACRVRNAGGELSAVAGFDGKYVVVSNTTEDSIDYTRIFSITQSGEAVNLDGTEKASYYDNGEDNYYNEITYMGNGQFFIHEDWIVEKEDDYTYYYNNEYRKVTRFVYDIEEDRRTAFKSDHYFLNLTNHYYGGERTGIGTRNILKDGYYYASYCIVVDSEKNGYYDQFILDQDFNVVCSLSGNFGESSNKNVEVDSVSYFDLALLYVDGIGVSPLPSSNIRAVDRDGNTIFTVEKTVTSAVYNNGVIIATTLNSSGATIYAVYDIKGKEIVPFSEGYTEINPFLGYYTTAKKDGKLVLLSKDGTVVEKMSDNETVPFGDIARTSSKTEIYKLGAYMFAETRKNASGEDTMYLGIKNLSADVNNNVILEANMLAGSMMYSPTNSPDIVFVFAKFEGKDEMVVYRLTTDKN